MSVSSKIYGTVYFDEDAANVFTLLYGLSVWDLASMSDDINVMSVEMGMTRLGIGMIDMPPGIEFLEAWMYEANARHHYISGSFTELNFEETPWMAVFYADGSRKYISFASLHGEDGIKAGPITMRNPAWPFPQDKMASK